MNQDRSSVFAILAVVVALILLQVVLWRFVCAIAPLGSWLQRYAAGWPAWARATSLLGSFKAVYPRAFAVFAARFVPASFTGLPLTLMCLAALYAAALLGGLIDDLRETEGLVGLDHGLNAFFVPYRTPSLIEAFMWITALGAGPAIAGMVAVASALLWSQERTRLLLPLWITFLGAQGTTWAGKYAIGRPRPAFLDAVTAASPSFPSGHATASTALIGFLNYVTARDLPNLRARFEVVFWCVAIIGLICFSRIFLSLHYFSDIAAGLLVGVFWLLVGFAVAEFDRRPPA
jgi:undecaprenyl-diphosphatase